MTKPIRQFLIESLSASPEVTHADEVAGADGKRLVRIVLNGDVHLIDAFCIGSATA